MKKALVCIASVLIFLATPAIGAESSGTADQRSFVLKNRCEQTAKMNARGKVVEISDEFIKIERKIKEKSEMMQFALEKPVKAIAVGDLVKIDYINANEKWTAIRVVKRNELKNSGRNSLKTKSGKSAAKPNP